MKLKPLQMPKKVEIEPETLTDGYGKFTIAPLERGFGLTIGNSLRRVLLSSIQGAAVTAVKIEGVLHEFGTIPGVLEDVTDILLNVKRLRIRMTEDATKTLYLKAASKKQVTGADIEEDSAIEIVNPEQHIATLSDGAKLDMELRIETGRGYVPAEQLKDRNQTIGVINLDALFSPVLRVNFGIEDIRVGQRTDYDKLLLEIWTDKTITPSDALAHAAKMIKDHMVLFITFEEEPEVMIEEVDEETEKLKKLLQTSVEELELSVRSSNCLKAAKIKTLGDLVRKTESEMLKYRNFGKKSLAELAKVLEGYGLHFGMDLHKIADESKEGEETGEDEAS
jgi:DNA-directed RNA polymerase subunit alpha